MSLVGAGSLASVKAGALGDLGAVDIACSAEYPPYEGGPLPPWYRDAGYPFRDLGAPCLALLEELLGPIQDVDAQWSSSGGDPNLAYDRWQARVKCARGVGQLRLAWGGDRTPSELTLHGSRRVLRVALRPDAPERAAAAATTEVARWVEQVARAAEADHAAKLAAFTLSPRVPYLVTGAAGALGKATVQRLLQQGHRVRVFVRRIPQAPLPGVEYAFGNLGDPAAVDRAVAGADKVIHIGAAMKGSWLEHKCGTVVGTQNVIAACKEHGVGQLVHVSSMSVIDAAGCEGLPRIDENVATEPRAEERGAYTRAKLAAEQLVAQAARAGLPCVILRPGQIFGGGIPLITGAVARSAGKAWLVLGDGRLELPLVYIDDVVDAIVAADRQGLRGGEVIQIIDDARLTQLDVLALAGGGKPVVRVPRAIVFALGKLSELPLGLVNKPSPIAKYRLRSALARLHYESDRAKQLLGWQPKVGVRQGIQRVS